MTSAQFTRLWKLAPTKGVYKNDGYTCGYETIEYQPRKLFESRRKTAKLIRKLRRKITDFKTISNGFV